MVSETLDKAPAFPATWETPFAEGETFYFDPMHFPQPLSPLTQSAIAPAFEAGFAAAAEELQAPIREYQVRYRNYYRFDRVVLAQPSNEEEARRMAEAAEATVKNEIGRLLERWHGEHLPRITSHLERLRTMDAQRATDAELLAMLAEVDGILRDLWDIHFLIAMPMLTALQLFDELYVDLFGGSEADAHALLVGAVSESVKAGFGLADLAAAARELGLASVLRNTSSAALLPTLESSEGGRALLSALRNYLETYGLRQDVFEFSTPTWQEDPSFALASIRNYVLADRDARAEHAAMAESADRSAAAAREQLSVYPEAVRNQFEAMLGFARQAAFLQEEHNFYIDQRGIALLRLFYLRVGKRLAETGRLAAPDDVFMLTVDELRDIVAGTGGVKKAEATRQRVRARREEMETARELTPPPFIGVPPAGPPSGNNPMERAMGRFFGGPPQAAAAPNQLNGSAGSRGVATGPARVARTLAEASSLLPGEVLVAITTMPPWTPLFGVAAAVVTETGGPLSHCAIVAREYGIPAVVGAHGATRVITTGQRITVDGGRGIVTIEA